MSRFRLPRDRRGRVWRLSLLFVPLFFGLALMRYFAAKRPVEMQGRNGFGNLGGRPTAIAWSPDGKTLVCATDNGYVQAWSPEIQHWRSFPKDTANGYAAGAARVLRLRFSRKGRALYSGGVALNTSGITIGGGVVSVYDVRQRRLRFTFGQVNAGAFDVSRDGHWAALGFLDFSTSTTPGALTSTTRHEGSAWLFSLQATPKPTPTPSSSTIGSSLPGAQWRDLPFRECRPRNGNIVSVALTPDGKTLAIGTDAPQNALSLWNTSRAKPISAPKIPTFSPTFLEWSPDGIRLATIGPYQIAILNLETGQVLQCAVRLSGLAAPLVPTDPATLAWSPNGKFLFSGGDRVRMWRASDLSLQRTFGVSGPVAVSPNGKTLATAKNPPRGEANGVLLWPLG